MAEPMRFASLGDEPKNRCGNCMRPHREHTLDALAYMMHGMRSVERERVTWGGRRAGKTFSALWRDEFNLTDEQMKSFGVDFGTKVAAVIVTWTPDGPRNQPITQEEFYTTGEDIMRESVPEGVERHWIPRPDWMRLAGYKETPDEPSGGNIGGNTSDDT